MMILIQKHLILKNNLHYSYFISLIRYFISVDNLMMTLYDFWLIWCFREFLPLILVSLAFSGGHGAFWVLFCTIFPIFPILVVLSHDLEFSCSVLRFCCFSGIGNPALARTGQYDRLTTCSGWNCTEICSVNLERKNGGLNWVLCTAIKCLQT